MSVKKKKILYVVDYLHSVLSVRESYRRTNMSSPVSEDVSQGVCSGLVKKIEASALVTGPGIELSL